MEEELRDKRSKTLIGVWDFLIKKGIFDGSRVALSEPLVSEVVEHYVNDVEILKARYKIPDKIQLPKIAGLMTAAILRYRPVLPLIDTFENDNDIYANEMFAVIHGLAICGEFTDPKENKAILEEPWFEPWLKDFIYLLHYRNVTAESIIFIYQTLAYFRYPHIVNKESL